MTNKKPTREAVENFTKEFAEKVMNITQQGCTAEELAKELSQFYYQYNLDFRIPTILAQAEHKWTQTGDAFYYVMAFSDALIRYQYAGAPELSLPFDAYTLQKALNELLAPRIKTESKTIFFGLISYALWCFGSSKNQAVLAIADWFRVSESTVKKALYYFEREIGLEDLCLADVLLRHRSAIKDFIIQTKSKNFPVYSDSYLKAEKAFKIFMVVCNEMPAEISSDKLKESLFRKKFRHIVESMCQN